MDWHFTLIVGLMAVAVLAFQRLGLVSAQTARTHLKQGALVVDVRSAEEFEAGHLPNAVNIPLDELRSSLPRRVSDKNQVLLLHCRSGARSELAQRMLKALGYSYVLNLGSHGRARRLVGR
ncbi:MAG: rhodanese-like domain-containing protein [Verrucomicrobiota bacterium]|nr:rhodanese-like domain-containing protein [Verrucomicrobiota bacterium]